MSHSSAYFATVAQILPTLYLAVIIERAWLRSLSTDSSGARHAAPQGTGWLPGFGVALTALLFTAAEAQALAMTYKGDDVLATFDGDALLVPNLTIAIALILAIAFLVVPMIRYWIAPLEHMKRRWLIYFPTLGLFGAVVYFTTSNLQWWHMTGSTGQGHRDGAFLVTRVVVE